MPLLNTPHSPLTQGIKDLTDPFAKKRKFYDSPHLAALFRSLYRDTDVSHKLSRMELERSRGTLTQGYDNAAANTRLQGLYARQAAGAEQQVDLGATAQGMTSAGLANTTVNTNAQRQAYAAGGSRLASLDQEIGGMLSNIALRKGDALAGLESEIGGLFETKQSMLGQIGSMYAEALRSGWTGNASGLPKTPKQKAKKKFGL